MSKRTVLFFACALVATFGVGTSALARPAGCLAEQVVIPHNMNKFDYGFVIAETSPELSGTPVSETPGCPIRNAIYRSSLSPRLIDAQAYGRDVKIRVGDFNGDGFEDVAVIRPSPHQVRIYYSNGGLMEYSERASRIVMDDQLSYSADDEFYVADFNGDGKSDLLVREKRVSQTNLYFGRISPEGNPYLEGRLLQSDGPVAATDQFFIGDFNGDGKTDFMIHTPAPHKNKVFLAQVAPSGGFSFLPGSEQSADRLMYDQNYKLFLGDFNGDGKTDYMMHRNAPHETSVYFGRVNPAGQFYFEARTLQSQDNQNYSVDFEVVVANFTADNKMDYALVNKFTNEINVYASNVAANGVFSFGNRIRSAFQRNMNGYTLTSGKSQPSSSLVWVKATPGDLYFERVFMVNNGRGQFSLGGTSRDPL